MRAAVVMFPGINAEQEMIRTLGLCGFGVGVVRHTETELPGGTDLAVIPGGFSYGDYLRCGALARTAPICPAIRRHGERGGLVLGVCNGFQILTEIGLLEGALTRNAGLRFECRDVFVKVEQEGPFTPRAGDVWKLVIAHGEGRWQASPEVFRRLQGEGKLALRYSTASGEITAEANPNGSMGNVAGLYGGPHENVFGLMPHPERASEEILGSADGRKLFLAVLAA